MRISRAITSSRNKEYFSEVVSSVGRRDVIIDQYKPFAGTDVARGTRQWNIETVVLRFNTWHTLKNKAGFSSMQDKFLNNQVAERSHTAA